MIEFDILLNTGAIMVNDSTSMSLFTLCYNANVSITAARISENINIFILDR